MENYNTGQWSVFQTAEGSAVTRYLSSFPSLSHTETLREAIVYPTMTHNTNSLSANSCPTQTGSIIYNAGPHKYMHADIHSGSVDFRAALHLHTDAHHPHRHMYTDEEGEKMK